MLRFSHAIKLGALLVFSCGPVLAATETVRDEFSSASYGNNDGSQHWANNWQEHDNGGGGASDGTLYVLNSELRLRGNTTNTNPNNQNRLEREVDLATPGATSATLSFDWRGSASLENDDLFFIEVSNNGGASFTVIDTLIGQNMESTSGAFTQDITGFISSNTQVRLRLIKFYGSGEQIFIDNLQIAYEVPDPVGPGDISGTVYLDGNADGANTGEAGQAGITVTAYDENGAAVATTVTDTNGDYLISGLDDSKPYRLEFTDIPPHLDPGPSGPDNNSTVVFVQSPQAGVEVGLSNGASFCQDNPTVATSKFINGNPLAGGSAAGLSSLHTFDYNASGTSGFATGATAVQTGTTWGLAYQRESKQLFSAAVLKRHAGLGPNGLGAIYVRDMDTGVTSLFTDVATLGMDLGTISANGSRGLPSNAGSPSNDTEAFAKVAKVGMGDIDLSDDGATMYVSNLNDRQIYAIPVGNPATAPASASPLPAQPWLAAGTCADGLARPWGLKNNAGKLYVGVVCTAEQVANDTVLANTPPPASLRAMVYEFNPASSTWTKPLDFPLDYLKGETSTVRHGSSLDRYWLPWTDRYVNDTITGRNQGVSTAATYLVDTTRTSRPMPILSDIEFDSTGSMILGFMDRGGMMFGNGNYPPTGTSPLHQYNVNGDILRACPAGASWTIESGGACGGVTGGGTNSQGPGGGEFYTGDDFRIHQETIMGGMVQHPGKDEITVVTMDPLTSVDAGGVKWLSNTTGSANRGLQLYQGGPDTPNNGTFGKGVGLGDLEILCDPAPLEIGNFVWIDSDQNGIQDPDEASLPNITIELWEDTTGDGTADTLVGTAVTDATGNYYFGGISDNNLNAGLSLNPATAYELRLPLNDADIPVNHVPTTQNQGTDIHDSDGDNGVIHPNISTIQLTTGAGGENNHSYDFGFAPPLFGDLEISKTVTGGTDPQNFTLQLDCSDNTFDDSAINLADGATHTVTDIPAGTSCSISETAPAAPSGFSYAAPVITPADGVTIVADTTVNLAVENQLVQNTGDLEITKTVVGGVDPQNFSLQLDCSDDSFDDSAISLANGATHNVTGIPQNTTCTVTETTPTPPAGFSYAVPVILPAAGVTIGDNTTVTIDVTNTLTQNTGNLDITKTVTGGTDPQNFSLQLDCSNDAFDDAAISLADGATHSVTGIPQGTTCSVTETAPTPPFGFSYGMPIITPTITVGDGTTVSITVENPLTQNTGNLNIIKTVTGGTDNQSFSLQLDCTDDAFDDAAITLAHGATHAVTGIPQGTTCTVTETAPTPPAGFSYGTPVITPAAGVEIGDGTHVNITVENQLMQNLGNLDISKTVTGGTDPQNFNLQLDCSDDAFDDAAISLAHGATHSVTGIPQGTTCSVTETAPTPPFGFSYGAPIITPTITVGDGTTVSITVENPLTQNTGNLNIIKTVTGGTDNQSFSLQLDCTDDAFDDAAITLAHGATHAVTGIPQGTTCTVTETAPTPPAGFSYGTPVITPAAGVEIGDGTHVNITVENQLMQNLGNLDISKTVTGGTDPQNFNLQLDCSDDAFDDAAISLAHGATHTVSGIPEGTTCTVTETAPTAPATFAYGAPIITPTVTIGDGTSVTIAVENPLTQNTGDLDITKTVTGGTDPQDFDLQLVCSDSSFDDPAIVLAHGATHSVTGIPEGTTCTVTETAPTAPATFAYGAAIITPTITIGDGTTVSIMVENPLTQNTGDLEITKTVTGGADPQNFNLQLDCSDDAFDDSAISLADGATHTVTGIPEGTTCSVAEAAPTPPAGFSYGAAIVTPAADITIGDGTTVSVGIENPLTQNLGNLSITKTVTGGTDPQSFSLQLDCSDDAFDDAAISLADGATHVINNVPEGTTCTVAETAPTPPTGFSYGAAVIIPAAGVTIGDGTTVTLEVTNPLTQNLGDLDITKTVSGGSDPQDFSLQLNCSDDAFDDAAISLAHGATHSVTGIPQGTTCTVTETAPTAPATFSYGAPIITPTVTIGDGTTVTIDVENPLTQNLGNLSLSKTVTGGADPQSFSLQLDCSDDAFDDAAISLVDGATHVINNIPQGTSCTVTETTPTPPAGFSYGTPVIVPAGGVTIGDGTTVTLEVTNPLTQNLGDLEITKTVVGGADPQSFSLQLDCSDDAFDDAAITLADGATHTVNDIPQGTTCSVTETAPTPPTGFSYGIPVITPVVTVGDGTTVSIAVENTLTRNTGTLEIAKTVSGGTDPQDFSLQLDCSDDAFDNTAITLADGATHTVTNIPEGTTCVVTETTPTPPNGFLYGAPIITPAAGVTIGNATTVSITVENPLIRTFDLALQKVLATEQAATIVAGDPVLFTITIFNQGTADAFDIDVIDYIPANTTYAAGNSSATGDLTTSNGATVGLINPDDGTFEISELASGDDVSFDIELITDGTFAGPSITNWAEISDGTDTDGGATTLDIDSIPDTTQFNGGGETDDLDDDNIIDQDGKNGGDEDDHDPALINITPKPVSIGSYVWEDTNSDGLQQVGEPPIADVIITLLDSTGSPVTDLSGAAVAPQTTGADGTYLFDNLPAGDYKVQVQPPAIYKKTPIQNPADDDDTENDSNIKIDITPGVLYESGVFTLAPETELIETNNEVGDDKDETPTAIADDASGNMTVDFGFVPLNPAISIEKSTNTEDADTAPGPTITVGDPITWAYVVVNTGEVALTAVTITDDKLADTDISCPADNNDNIIDTLAINATVTCTATGTASAGAYLNNASVTGTPPDLTLPSPTDNDPSNYFGGSSSIDIEKATNGDDADTLPGPTINVNDTVSWTYAVVNTGNVTLSNVTISDDQLDQATAGEEITCTPNDGANLNIIPTLAAGASASCSAIGVATEGQYINNSSVTGTPPTGTPPTDNDPSHYFGGSASIDIEKATNGDDADIEPGPTINVDDTVTWTYVVQNTGNVTLTNVTVTDDQLDQATAGEEINCTPNTGSNLHIIPSLAAGASASCTATGVSTAGQYTNNASVTGTPPTGTPPTDNDPSHYFGGSASIDVEKATNGDDADMVPGPTINVGDTVIWTYTIENTGNVTLNDVTVTDDQLADADIACPVDDGDNIIASMATGQVILCTATGTSVTGQYTNNASVTGTPPAGPPPTDNDPSHYFGGSASIDIEKATNGDDADAEPGPTINVGEPITWTYTVENTGNVVLTDVTVTDDQLADVEINCPVDNNDHVIASMAVGQVILCTASGIATAGQYTNNSSVTGTPPTGAPPSDNDPSHYFGGSSSIDIEKATNGDDADVEPGPTINVDDTVTWTYRVENTGNVTLNDVTITDDQLADTDISCPVDNNDNIIASMAVGQIVLCTASGVATIGQYSNNASVTGAPPAGPPPSDDDPSHYFGGSASVDIEKATNGDDADTIPGPTIAVGAPVTWTYTVENTGNVTLTTVTVTDDKLTAADISCPVDDNDNVIDSLAAGQVILCTASGIANEGQYENTATVSGTPPGSNAAPQTDNDPSHYFGGSSAIDIEKATNGDDADIAPGPTIAENEPVTWTYTVENTGNVNLTNVTVTDDKLDQVIADEEISCAINDGNLLNVIPTLAVDQVVLCTATGLATLGQYENTASVTGTPPTGAPPTDNDPSHYFGGSSSIDVEKSTNGEDADITPGPTIGVDDTVTWTYRIENTGNVVLTEVIVTDDKLDQATTGEAIACAINDGTVLNVIPTLSVGQVVLCSATGIAAPGQYSNNASVTGTPPAGIPPSDDDPSNYFGGDSAIDIEKATDGDDADVEPGPTISVGDTVTWTYRVENTGNVDLTAVTVIDDQLVAADISCPVDDNDNIIDQLPVGQVVVCTATGLAEAGQYTNNSSVTATPPAGIPAPSDNDPSHYFGGSSSIDVEKSTNGADADATPGPTIAVGDTVAWRYTVENTGNVELTNVTVIDDQGVVISCPIADSTPDDNIIDRLAAGQIVVCNGSGIAQANQYANSVTVTGTPPAGPPTTDNDPSHYFGATSSIALEKSTNGEDADDAPGPNIPVDEVVTWTYRVTNTGTSTLLDVEVTDDRLDQATADEAITCSVNDGAVLNVIPSLAIGQTVLCTATGVAEILQYANTGLVVGTPDVPNAPFVTADDPSHYFGADSGISLEKSTNGTDADITPGPTIDVGDTVTWTYRVENTGNVNLSAVTVTDNQLPDTDIICPADNASDNIIDTLAVGQVVSCTATGTSLAGQYANIGTVTGTPLVGVPPIDTDPSHYFGASASVTLEKLTNNVDADITPGPTISIDGAVTWSYEVTNTGNVDLVNVTVTDDKVAAVDINCPVDDGDNIIATLTLGQTVVCTASGVSVAGQYDNTATVTGTPPSGPLATDTDPSHYFGADEKVDIEKSTNGEDADVAPGPTIQVGNAVTWSYRVTNTGNVRLDDVVVTDDMIAAASIVCLANNGTSNIIAALTPGQSVVCTATDVAVEGPYENMSAVVGTPVDEMGVPLNLPEPTDNDPSHYVGFKPVVHLGSTVFEDPNNNGLQDASENGIDGVLLQLFLAGDPPTGTPLAETTSANGGDYIFTDLDEGSYYVFIPVPPVGLELSSVPTNLNDDQTDGDDNGDQAAGAGTPVRSPDIALNVNQEPIAQETFQGGNQDDTLDDSSGDMTIDFGFLATPASIGTIGDTLYFDENNNKIPESDEGMSGVTVELFDNSGTLVATTETDQLGQYLFTNLPLETSYAVNVDTSTLAGGGAGWINSVDPDTPTPNNGDMGDNESVVTLTATSPVNIDQDFGYIGGPNSLSGTIWQDADKDGVFDSSNERVYTGVTVELRDPVTQQVIQTATTDADGNYAFSNLPDGRFTVVVTDEGGILNGTEHTTGSPGVDNNSQAPDGTYIIELDPQGVLATGVEASDQTSDFGYFDALTTPITLGSFSSHALTADSVQFSWTTESEVANAGFVLYQKVGDQWLSISHDIIPAVGTSLKTEVYNFSGEQVSGATFVLVDVDNRGHQTLHGPFVLGKSYGVEKQPVQLEIMRSTVEAASDKRANIKRRANTQGFKTRLDRYLNR